jgi:hypothetical protein
LQWFPRQRQAAELRAAYARVTNEAEEHARLAESIDAEIEAGDERRRAEELAQYRAKQTQRIARLQAAAENLFDLDAATDALRGDLEDLRSRWPAGRRP